MAREQRWAQESPVRLLLSTDRPVVLTFFERLAADRRRFEVRRIPVSADRLGLDAEEVASASVALVDLGLDPPAGARVCEELNRLRPGLPVAAVVCCPDSATARTLRVLLARGIDSILDLQGTPEETLRAVETLAGGGSVLQLRLRRGQRTVLASMLTGAPPTGETQVRLLELVACGLSDREIGQRLHLSPHTVKHQIEGLRHDLGVRNRTELAAWAGQHGFYALEAAKPSRLHVRLPDRAPA